MADLEKFKIHRDGMKDLVFKGLELGSACSRTINGPGQNRYSTLTIYRTGGGKYVYHDEYTTHWQGESGASEAEVYDTAEDLINDLIGADGEVSELKKDLIKSASAEDEAFIGILEERIE
jgi:hypothetical protein